MRTFNCLYLLHLKIGCEYRKEWQSLVLFMKNNTGVRLGFSDPAQNSRIYVKNERLLRCLNGLVVVLQF
jgi:hypothetical protein